MKDEERRLKYESKHISSSQFGISDSQNKHRKVSQADARKANGKISHLSLQTSNFPSAAAE